MRTPAGPIREELFSVERLEQFAGELAARQGVHRPARRGRRLLPRLRENARALVASHRAIEDASRRTRSISPAADWLLNNFHIVEEQVREIQEDLPPGFYRELPKLAEGALAGFPRVYGLAWSFVAHTDSRIDLETFGRFVRAYQRVQPLTIGELWALAISLRLVLVENLRRLAERVAARGTARDRADGIADVLLGTAGVPKPERSAVLPMLERAPFSQAFAVQLVQRLREQDPAVTPALEWLDRRFEQDGTTAEEIVREEHQQQIANHATVRNVITSMRLLSSADWADFFESVSLVHEALCDGTRVAEMDFATRDRYRHAVEELSRGSRHDELEVARRAVAMAAARAPTTRRNRPVRFPPRGSGLLPDCARAPAARGGARVPAAGPAVAGTRLGAGRDTLVPRRDRVLEPRRRGRAGRADRARRRECFGGRASRAARPGARLRSRDRVRPSIRHAAPRAAAPPQARARGRRARGAPNAGRHPGAPDRRVGDRRGRPEAGSALPRQHRSRAAVRAPVGLARRSRRERARGRGPAGTRSRRDRPAQRTARPGRGRR